MFLKQLENWFRHIRTTSRVAVRDRRSGMDRRQRLDRRCEVRFSDEDEGYIHGDRRQLVRRHRHH